MDAHGYDAVGGHDPALAVAGDHDPMTRFYMASRSFAHVPACPYGYRLHEQNVVKVHNAAVREASWGVCHLGTWIKCGRKGFMAADVIRWREAVWERRGAKSGKPVKIGERLVTAEVLRDGKDGWVRLLVRACAVLNDKTGGRRVHPLTTGEEIKRKRETVQRGKPERLPWSNEGVRETLTGQTAGSGSRSARAGQKDRLSRTNEERSVTLCVRRCLHRQAEIQVSSS